MFALSSITDPQLIDLLSAGKVGVMPTDTIYGLAATASNKEAVKKLADIKDGDTSYRPGTVIAANVQQLIDLGVDASAVNSVAKFWPNPLSIELPLSDEMSYLHQDGPHRAFRVVNNKAVRELLEKTGPLLTTSVNHHGMKPAVTLDEAMSYFSDEVDFYVEGGDLSGHPPSTVARLSGGSLEIVRQGAAKIDESGRIL